MKNGNATFRRWLHLCLLLLAIFPAVARAFTWTGTYTGNGETCVWTFTYSVTWTISGNNVTFTYVSGSENYSWTPAPYQGGSVHGGYLTINVPGVMANQAFSPNGWTRTSGDGTSGTMTAGGGSHATFSILGISGSTPVYGPDGSQIGTLAGGPIGQATLTVNLTVTNNRNRVETISMGTAPTQTLPALSTRTLTFSVTGPSGTTESLGASPDTLILDGNPDPLVIGPTNSTATCSGHIGAVPLTQHMHAVFINYATSVVSMVPTLDGTSVGHVDAHASADGVTPNVTSYDWNLSISPDATFTFSPPSGHTASIRVQQSGGMTEYIVTIDSGGSGQAVASTTPPSSDGTTTTVSTNPTTGATTIDHSTPDAPTNSATDPGTVFGGTSAPNGGTTGTYGDTTSSAASAAAQDSSNSLAAIANNTKNTADATQSMNTTMTGISSDGTIGTNALKGTLSDLMSNKAQSGVNYAQSAATQGQANASTAYNSFGTAPTMPTDPGDAGDPTVDLKVSSSKTITVHLNPFSSSGPFGGAMSTAAAFVRRLIAWGIVATFFIWCAGRIREMTTKPFNVAPFGDSLTQSINSVKIFGWGGGVGYAVKLVVYALLLTIILTMPLVVMASVTAGLPWSMLVSTWSAGPGTASGIVGSAVSMANQVVPWSMLMAAPVWYFAVEFILFPSQFFWMMFIKFLPV